MNCTTTALQNADTLSGNTYACGGCTNFAFGNSANRFDVVNVNVGFYTTWLNQFTTYTGIVTPLDDGSNRFFDLEAQMTFTYRF